MGAADDKLEEFIESIPDAKLTGFADSGNRLWSTRNFRLDMQGMTSQKPPKYNLQVQVNNGTNIPSLKPFKGETVAGPVLVSDGTSADVVRQALLDNMKI